MHNDRSVQRYLVLLLAAVLVFSFTLIAASCGDDEEADTTEPVATTAPPTETTGAETTEAPDGVEVDGEEVWASTCAVCHGAEGEGGTGPNLQERTDLTKERVVEQATNGGGAMPAYSPQLSDQQIDAVADYVVEDIVQQ